MDTLVADERLCFVNAGPKKPETSIGLLQDARRSIAVENFILIILDKEMDESVV